MKKNSISVVIATKDRARLLGRCIESIAQQLNLPDQIVVVDDNSSNTQEVKSIVNSFINLNIKLLFNDKTLGASSSRNKGVHFSTSKFVAFLDDDDVFLPSKILELRALFDNENPDIVFHPAEIIMVNEKLSYFTKPKIYDTSQMVDEILVSNFIGGAPMVAVRRDSFLAVGGFDVELTALEDYELWIRLVNSGCNLSLLQKVLTRCYFTTSETSVSKSVLNNRNALDAIKLKHSKSISNLSKRHISRMNFYHEKLICHKHLLNHDSGKAFTSMFIFSIRNFNVRGLTVSFLYLLGIRILSRLKG